MRRTIPHLFIHRLHWVLDFAASHASWTKGSGVHPHINIYIYICDFLLRQSYIMPLYSHHISFYPQELNKLVKHHDMPKKYPHLARIFRWCFPILFHDIPSISPIVFPQKKWLIAHGNVHLSLLNLQKNTWRFPMAISPSICWWFYTTHVWQVTGNGGILLLCSHIFDDFLRATNLKQPDLGILLQWGYPNKLAGYIVSFMKNSRMIQKPPFLGMFTLW